MIEPADFLDTLMYIISTLYFDFAGRILHAPCREDLQNTEGVGGETDEEND